jgi:hypothetical protein
MKKKLWGISLLSVVIMLISSCASTTMIRSYPENASIYINGEHVGETPYPYTDSKISFSSTNIRLEKEGYEPVYETLCRDEEIDAGAVVGGLLFWYPFLWTFKYKPVHSYDLEPIDGESEMAYESPGRDLTQSEIDQLRQLKSLLDEGVLTPEEYQREKEKILTNDY